MHSRGIIHRDIKPNNAMVYKKNDIRLGDFGNSKDISYETTTINGVVGTFPYAA